mgnify:CR=1 FL=1
MPKTKHLAIAILTLVCTAIHQVGECAPEEKDSMFSIGGWDEGKTNPIPKSATKGKRFDPEYWDMELTHPTSRLEMFNFFLQDNDLVGMKQDKIILLLGEGYSLPDGYNGDFRLLHYVVMSGGCDPNKAFGVNIYLKHGRAFGWSFTQNNKCSQLFTENVLIQIKPDERTNFFRIGNSSENNWPEVTPKHNPDTKRTKGKNKV